jgi:putative ATP-binding cassette transporter
MDVHSWSGHATLWQLIKSYWRSKQRASAYLTLCVIIGMTIALVGVDVLLNYWYNSFYNALQAYDKKSVIHLLGFFCLLAASYIIIAVYRYYISQKFGLRWRRWLTDQFIARWLRKRSYYYLENFDEQTDNPDQRIQEDITTLVSSSIDLTTGLVTAIATLVAFIYVLWHLSGVITFSLGSWGVMHIPGYLVWVSIIYSLVGSFITLKIGRPLVPLNFEQQRREATFRFAAVDLRTHAEDVALYRGEQHQKSILKRLFSKVLENWYLIILRQKLLLWFTAGFNQISVLLPLLVALPHYFDKVFLLGGLMQSIQAFSRIQDAMSFFVNSYSQIAQWQAVGRRLTTFANHMHEVDARAKHADHLIFRQHAENSFMIKDVTIQTPQGRILLQKVNEKLTHGPHYLIQGQSGIGKSTLVRTIAGIWPYVQGEIILPQHQPVMYLPQEPYMPLGTLAEAILFPAKNQPELDAEIKHALRDCHLELLIPRLHETARWSEQLSPGERQRIAFARVLLHKPQWVFLDESTSALDLANEAHFYQLLKERLPKCSIVSVGHRPSLKEFHDRVINIEIYHPVAQQCQ